MHLHIRKNVSRLLLWASLLIFFLAGSSRSQFSPSFHDLGGGRIPTADGAAWLVSSAMATQGHRLSWPARRPLNVSFNAPLIVLADRIADDPVHRLLVLKRLLAFAAIAGLVVALCGLCSDLSRLGIGLSLLSVLFTGGISKFSYLIGHGLGYTQGSELNAFIFVVAGVACLILACREGLQAEAFTDQPSWRGRWRMLAAYALGLLLLAAGAQMRPGTLLLLPLMIGLFAAGHWHSLQQSKRRRSVPGPMGWRAFLLASAAGLAGALLLQQLAFAQVSDHCGALGGNQGLTLYGLSQGKDWSAGLSYVEKNGISCERVANQTLRERARRALLNDPKPALRVMLDNIDSNNTIGFTEVSKPGRRSWAIGSAAVAGFVILAATRRFPGRDGLFTPLNTPLLIGMNGWLSMELFIIPLFQDAYLRPLTPYAVFPVLSIWLIADRLVFFRSALETRPPSKHRIYVLWGCLALALILLIGNLVLWVDPSLGRPGKPDTIRGQFIVKSDQLSSLGIDMWIFNLGLPSNYRLAKPLPPELSKPGSPLAPEYCLSYERRRLLDSFDAYGSFSIAPGACRP